MTIIKIIVTLNKVCTACDTGKTPRHLKVTVSDRASKYFPIIAKPPVTGTLG